MANLTQPINIKGKYDQKDVIKYPLAAVKVYRGAAVVLSTAGYANKPTNTAGEKFLGYAEETIDNSAGAAGDLEVKLIRKGLFKPAAWTGGTPVQTNAGQPAYLSDDQTLTLVPNNNLAGRVELVESTGDTKGDIFVRIDSATALGAAESVAGADVKTIAVQLADLANAAVYKLAIPYSFVLLSVGFRALKAPTTTSKLATATAQISGTPCTGGVISLTTAACLNGALVAGTAITALNTGAPGGTVELAISAVTAFVEGDGQFELVIGKN